MRSVEDVQYTLLITIGLVLMVVALFMRRLMPTIAAAVTVPLSICGTLGAMYLLGYSLDNFSLMALTISVGFVVDDAIVMIENIFRHVQQGMTPLQAALAGSRQIGFTVISISISLVAVFIPLLFMGGVLGRLLHEFAVTLTVAIAISAAVSLTLTPMICGRFMPANVQAPPTGVWGRVDRGVQHGFVLTLRFYARTLSWALRHRALMLLVFVATVVLTVRLYGAVPKAFLPEQDTGLLIGATLASPDVSFQAMVERQRQVVDVLLADPAIDSVGSVVGVSSGWASLNRGQLYVSLKPLWVRGVGANAVIDRLRPKLAQVGGVQTTLYLAQDLRGGGRTGGAQYQFVLIAPELDEMRKWSQLLEDKLRVTRGVTDVTSDQDRAGPQVDVTVDRAAAARLGISVSAIDNALDNAYSQRQISTIYTQRNQYKVVLEVDPHLQTDPSMLDRLYVGATGGKQIPLSAVAHFTRDTAPLSVHHQGQFPAATLSFNTAEGLSLGEVTAAIEQAVLDLRMPDTVHTEFAGNARFLAQSLQSEPWLIAAALLSIYIVLGALVRKPDPPADDRLDVAVGRPRRAPRVAGHGDGPVGHGHDRHHPADGHRQEERHHAGRFRAGGRARARPCRVRGDPRGLHRTVPPDRDDNARRDARRNAARLRLWHRGGAAPPARHRDRRRAARVADADALHDAGHLSGAGTPRGGTATEAARCPSGGIRIENAARQRACPQIRRPVLSKQEQPEPPGKGCGNGQTYGPATQD